MRDQIGDWTDAIDTPRIAMQHVKLVWDCHLECARGETRGSTGLRVEGDLMTHLRLMTAEKKRFLRTQTTRNSEKATDEDDA